MRAIPECTNVTRQASTVYDDIGDGYAAEIHHGIGGARLRELHSDLAERGITTRDVEVQLVAHVADACGAVRGQLARHTGRTWRCERRAPGYRCSRGGRWS